MVACLLLVRTVIVLFIWNNIKICLCAIQGGSPLKEYCEGSDFTAQCGPEETIIITNAIYGRMRIGECIKRSFGEMNCQLDVRHKLDYFCSGRRRCEVRVALIYESLTALERPCSDQVRSYLEASYTCVKVIQPQVAKCNSENSIGPAEITQSQGYISNLVTQETNCGSYELPWTIHLNPGLKMKITLYDFAYSSRKIPIPDNTCQVYAVIKEKTNSANAPSAISKTVCGRDSRERIVYTSNRNQVEIRVVKNREPDEGKELPYFLLRFEAFGCTVPPPPKYGWQKIYNDRIELGCNRTDVTWSLICEHNIWIGQNKSCVDGNPEVGRASEGKGGPFSFTSGSQWAAFIIIACIAVTIGLVIFMMGLFYIRRKRTAMDARGSNSYQRPSIPDFYAHAQPATDTLSQPNYTTRKGYPTGEPYGHPFTNDYMRTWQMQRHHNRLDTIETMPNIHTGQPIHMEHQHHIDQQQSMHSQIDGRPMSEHIYESPNFERKFRASENGFEPLQRVTNKLFCDDESDGSSSLALSSNRNAGFSSHHTA